MRNYNGVYYRLHDTGYCYMITRVYGYQIKQALNGGKPIYDSDRHLVATFNRLWLAKLCVHLLNYAADRQRRHEHLRELNKRPFRVIEDAAPTADSRPPSGSR